MKRERLLWIAAFALIVLVSFRAPRAAQRDSDYLFVKTLVDVNRLVAKNYVEEVDPSKLEQAAISGMLEVLDPFTNYIPPAQKDQFNRIIEGSFKGVGIHLEQNKTTNEIIIVSPIEGSPAHKAGVQSGDIIVKVNDLDVTSMKLDDVMTKIKGELNSDVTLTVRRDAQLIPLTMKRQEIVLPTVMGYDRNPDNSWNYYISKKPKIGYIRVTQFTANTTADLRDALEPLAKDKIQGLVLDLRWNPGGLLDQAVKTIDMLVPKDSVILSTKGNRRPEERLIASGLSTLPHFPMIVMVNEHSASAAEIVAGSLMDNGRAIVLGTRSYGKGSVQEVIPLEQNSGELKLTVAYYYLPSGRLVHKKKDATDWGVEPQINVPMDDDAQYAVQKAQSDVELMHKVSATSPSSKPTTQPAVDAQLDRAIQTLIYNALFQPQSVAKNGPTTGPATRPVNLNNLETP